MTALEQTILADWESNKTPIEVIAADQELEIEVIKSVLMRHSSQYREQNKSGNVDSPEKEQELLRKAEVEELEAAYKQLALYTDNEHIKERALRHLINDRKGRLDKKVGTGMSMVKNTKINVMVLNETFKKNRQEKMLKQIKDLSGGVLELSNS